MTTDAPTLGKKFLRSVRGRGLMIAGCAPMALAATEKSFSLPARAGLFAIGLVLLIAGICHRYGLGKKETTITNPFGSSMKKTLFPAQMLGLLGGGFAVTAANHAEYSLMTRLGLAGAGAVLILAAFCLYRGKSKIQSRAASGALVIPGLGLIALMLTHPENSPTVKIIMLAGGGLLWLVGTVWAFLRGDAPWSTAFFFILLPSLSLLADYFSSGSAVLVVIPFTIGAMWWTRGQTRANLAALAGRLGYVYEESGLIGTSWKMTVKGRRRGHEVEYTNPLFKMSDKRTRYFSVAVNYAKRADFCLSLEALAADTNLMEDEFTTDGQTLEPAKIADLDNLFLIRTTDVNLAQAIFTPKMCEQVRVWTTQENPFILLFHHGQAVLALQGNNASREMLTLLEESMPLLGDFAERVENAVPANSSRRN